MSTPTPGKARQSGIPTPGKPSSIPTPGRLRSASSATQQPPQSQDDEFVSRAFADAIKANDPAQHRGARSSDVSVVSLSVASQTGRRSVAGRPSSVASSSSAASSSLAKTPGPPPRTSAARPPSRQSDAFPRAASRAGRAFEVGDNVRIESLGFEGILRYLGEIDGKAGLWAGVELSGGFSGKGKNNGIVNGKPYFSCPPNCGVFVATTKLSAPTVGYGGMSRPSSVASTRSGRMTPSVSMSGRITPSASSTITSGRKTPSISNGRITPSVSNGRVTPAASGRKTPSYGNVRPKATTSYQANNAITPIRPSSVQTTITPGSRASKYIGMTAKQLDSRSSGAISPSRRSTTTGSPVHVRSSGLPSSMVAPMHLPSPTRSLSSPFTTPKALNGGRTSNIGVGMPSTTPSKSRPSTNTPRARIPSAVAMPPPASPSLSSRLERSASVTNLSSAVLKGSDLESSGKALQERIADLVAGRVPSSDSRSSSVTSGESSPAFPLLEIENLQMKLSNLEAENERLRAAAQIQTEQQEVTVRMDKLVSEQNESSARITELEASVRANERLLNERESTIESLERAAQATAQNIDKIKGDAEARTRDIQSKLDDKEALVANLKELLEAKEGLQTENDAVLCAKDAEIGLLEARVQKAYTELEEERRELGSQVDELRKAGQETIALYEERLSVADARRYELEDLVASLEEKVRAQAQPVSPVTARRQAESAAEIDNEMLREQIQHLQKRIALLEDQLEDARAQFDREEAAVRERVKRYKDREENMRKELTEGNKEVERLLKSEEHARQRVEEMEEALRESRVALENARAEIEILRNELADREGINPGGHASPGVEWAHERTRLVEEIAQLKGRLASVAIDKNQHIEQLTRDASYVELQSIVDALQIQKASLERLCEERDAELANERAMVQDLQVLADERASELEGLRKKLNRELSVNGIDSGKGSHPSSPSKSDLSAARDEITGLKHIIQELQKENSAASQQNKVLESENKLLLSETEQLREDLKILEDNVEKSLLREEQALASETGNGSTTQNDTGSMQTELEQLRKKHMDAEMKSARTIHDLNKEISELETLIESKIYREDELERELERMRDKLARSQRKSSRPSTEPPLSAVSSSSDELGPLGSAAQDVCEICERPGHDIFNCDLLKDEAPLKMRGGAEDLFCEDCEEPGHTAADCPHSQDVF